MISSREQWCTANSLRHDRQTFLSVSEWHAEYIWLLDSLVPNWRMENTSFMEAIYLWFFNTHQPGVKIFSPYIRSVCDATQVTVWRTISSVCRPSVCRPSVCSIRCAPMCAYPKIFPRAFTHRDRSVGCFRCKQPQSGNNSMLSFPSRARGRGRKINQSLKIKGLVSFLNATHEASSSTAWCLSSIWMGPDDS